MTEKRCGSVLVMGGGIAGIKAALDLAELGRRVYLIEASPALGGILSQLDYQFPDNHCGLCRMLPTWERDLVSEFCMREVLFHENIIIMTSTGLMAVNGEAGRFEVSLKSIARGVDTNCCIGCGRCEEVCPVQIPDHFNEDLTFHKAIYKPVPHNLINNYVIDFEHCRRCEECVRVCPTAAIDLFGEDTQATLQAGAIILAPGCGFFDPASYDFYGYGRIPGVITNLELERIISAGGPSGGKLIRPSDGGPVRRVAWLQCVGSRNKKLGLDYCSSICCMIALKESVLIKERFPEAECVIFYMDLRTYGKDSHRYRLKVESSGVELIRCRIHTVELDQGGRPVIRYLGKEGKIITRSFDLVVLSIGRTHTSEMRELAEAAGVNLDEQGFAGGREFSPVSSSRKGIYCCGSFTGFRDIAETIVQAQAAALMASIDTGVPESKNKPNPRDVSLEEPRVGLLLCRCFDGHNQDFSRDVLKTELSEYSHLVEDSDCDRLCLEDGYQRAKAMLEKKNFNRLIVAACRQYLYSDRLKRLGEALGILKHLVEVIDFKGLDIDHQKTGEKKLMAKGMIAGAVLGLQRKLIISNPAVPVEPGLLVVGGGLAGMTGALCAAAHGIRTWLVEKTSRLGGESLRRRYRLDGCDPEAFIRHLEEKVESEERIQVLYEAELISLTGAIGRFWAGIRQGEAERLIHCGAVILATGGHEAGTGEYQHGRDSRVMLQGELEKRLAQGRLSSEKLRCVVMIQCVGSRNDDRTYCSRICCATALKNALKIKEIHPQTEIAVLYRDLMAYGFLEKYYTMALEKGIIFFSYQTENKPEVISESEGVKVTFWEPVIGRPVELTADLLVLSTGIVPADQKALAQKLGIELDPDGFFQEMDRKWRPLTLNRAGVFVCGLAHSPGNMAETILQAQAAAMESLIILSKKELQPSASISAIKPTICAVCETCIEVCPFGARYKDGDEVKVVAAACQGCGICVAACPSGAAWLPLASEKQIMGTLEGLLAGV